MRTLALDTTGAFGSIALLLDDEVLEEVVLHCPEGFSTVLFPRMQELLRRHDLTAHDLDVFASAAGPGSFTGVRVGLAAVKALADASGRPAFGVSNLLALAACGAAPVRAAVLDARRGEVYAACFDSELQALTEEIVAPFPSWIRSLPATITEFISSDASAFRPHLPAESTIIEQRTIAGAVGRIARQRFLAGENGDPAALDANYVRRADAELKWKDVSTPPAADN